MSLTVDLWIPRYGCETKKAWLSGDHVLQFQLVEMNTATKVMTLLELWNQGLSNLSELSVGERVKSCMLLKTALATIFSNPPNAVQSYSRLISVFVSCYGFGFFLFFSRLHCRSSVSWHSWMVVLVRVKNLSKFKVSVPMDKIHWKPAVQKKEFSGNWKPFFLTSVVHVWFVCVP